jgi:gliding motility-associated lipoprotein GldK
MRKEIDPRKLYYSYYWFDMVAAAKKDFSDDKLQGNDYSLGEADAGINVDRKGAWSNRKQGYSDRSVYARSEVISVYPDTLCWIHDYSYSFNDPMTEKYFWHPAYDNYPVVGVTWQQARAFCVWRTELLNSYLRTRKGVDLSEFRLPTETEWEWAARGGHMLNPYPWGGPNAANAKGCFMANFKPRRGNYLADGGLRTLVVGCYPPNGWGLYDMAGNVAEWTSTIYTEAGVDAMNDVNPQLKYNAAKEDPYRLKKKSVRGGSWKDPESYIRSAWRSSEYQNQPRSYIGFRCVRSLANTVSEKTKPGKPGKKK